MPETLTKIFLSMKKCSSQRLFNWFCVYDNFTLTDAHLVCDSLCQVVPAWLNCLPITGDLIEAKVVHELLCSMVER